MSLQTEAVLANQKRWHVEASDCVSFLRTLPPECVQVVCTSPPYWALRSYLSPGSPLKPLELGQEPNPKEYVANLVKVFCEIRRVLRPDGVVWLNVGDSYAATGKSGGADTAGPRGGKWRRAPMGLKPLDQCNVPHRLYLALIQSGWYGRADAVWSKTCAMPESVRGWRWERCPACPGCDKCSSTGGYVLRKGSWRPTRSHEYIFLLTKSSSYFSDDTAVRTALAPTTLSRDQYSRILDDPDEQYAARHDHERISNPAGANPRSVFRYDATAMDVFRWLADTDPALGEVLWRRWREGQGLHSVLTVGPEPLRAKHYAAYPTRLVIPLLRATTSEQGQCRECGAPRVRVVRRPRCDRSGPVRDRERDGGLTSEDGMERTGMSHHAYAEWLRGHSATTTGWRATCQCNAPSVPHLILDPFAGSGRTGMAARQLGLRFLGSELSPEYAALANNQILADSLGVSVAKITDRRSLCEIAEGQSC